MPSSISNSDERETGPASGNPQNAQASAFHVRLTASDRPGVAQPVPERDVPARPWNRVLLLALTLLLLLLAAWEWYWRAAGATPGYRNTDGLWAIQRRRIDQGEGNATVLIGASRMMFDVQLPEWERLAGSRPIQLSFEGTSPVPFMEDLAADPKFTGRLLVGVTPDAFFIGFARHVGALKYYRKESPAQRVGQWLSTRLIEPYLAFYDPDFALVTVLKRQPWPARPGKFWVTDVRKLFDMQIDRNTYLWSKVETDADYRALAKRVWAERFAPSPEDPPEEKIQATIKLQIDRVTAAVSTLRARGVEVIFIRHPSGGDYLAFENKRFPRAQTWEVLLARTGARGIHFEDYPQLREFDVPEWSHLSRADATRYTQALYAIIEHDPAVQAKSD